MASLTFIIWQVRFAIWSQNHVPLGKVTSSLIPTALFIYWESMFSPYFSIHSDLFILKWNTLTMEQGRLHFPKYEIKFLSSESDANHWHSKSVLNQWTLALLASFQDLPQGPEEGSFFLLGFPSPPVLPGATRAEEGLVFAGLGAGSRGTRDVPMYNPPRRDLCALVGSPLLSSPGGHAQRLWIPFPLQKSSCGPHTHFLAKK